MPHHQCTSLATISAQLPNPVLVGNELSPMKEKKLKLP